MDACRTFRVRELMEKSTLTDVKNWRSDKLLPNPSNKRMKVVKKGLFLSILVNPGRINRKL